jgi:hypothetical protein
MTILLSALIPLFFLVSKCKDRESEEYRVELPRS